LGRFIIGDAGQLVAVGIVKDVEKTSVGITGRATATKRGNKIISKSGLRIKSSSP
jgi:hypothetical protein